MIDPMTAPLECGFDLPEFARRALQETGRDCHVYARIPIVGATPALRAANICQQVLSGLTPQEAESVMAFLQSSIHASLADQAKREPRP